MNVMTGPKGLQPGDELTVCTLPSFAEPICYLYHGVISGIIPLILNQKS